ncbi:MAG TPA: gliding motility-associated C-terminal domain-containing protein, partial [Saprospiraceae bacterium]|nr:gliding motility-associated C-terminal domain-containing protein [Saprospiraceae bacterium]
INRQGPVEVKVNGLPTPPQITANSSGILCEGSPHLLSLVNPLGNLSYQWSNGKKSNQIEVSAASSYSVVAKDANGCKAKSNEIIVANGPDVGLVPSGCFERCAPDTLCFPFISGVAGYQWYKNGIAMTPGEGGNQTFPIITMDGNYHVQLTGINGCITLSEPLNLTLKSPVGTISGKVYSDVNANGVIDNADTLLNGVILMSGQAKDTTALGIYELVNITAGMATIEVDTHSLPAGSKILTTNLTTSLVGCDDEKTLDILIGINCVSQNKITNYLLCPGDVITIEGKEVSENANLTYIKPVPGGCADTFHYLVELKAPILASIQSEAACPGQNNGTLIVTSSVNETFSVLINGQVKGTNSGAWGGFASGNYKIELVDNHQCITAYETTIQALKEPEFTITAENLTCIKTEAVASINLLNYTDNQVSIQWSNLSTAVATSFNKAGEISVKVNNGCGDVLKTFTIEQEKARHEIKKYIVCNGNKLDLLNQQFQQDTTFNLYTAGANGCIDTTSYQLNFSPEYDIELEVKGSCPGLGTGSIIVHKDENVDFRYFLNEQPVIVTDQTIHQLYFGNYKLTIKDNNGCQENIMVEIPEKEEVAYKLLDEDISCFKGIAEIGIEVTNYVEGEVQFLWNSGVTNPTIKTEQTGDFQLKFNNGCEEKTVEFQVGTTDKLPSFELPNILSPIGQNSVIDLQYTPFAASEIVRFDIYDRMGKLIHKTSPGNHSWDGRFGTNPMPSGVYVYFIEANVDICGKTENMKKAGTITILR